MRKLVLILLSFIAVVTFIRVFDKPDDVDRVSVGATELTDEYK
jgi:hypothetical protein